MINCSDSKDLTRFLQWTQPQGREFVQCPLGGERVSQRMAGS